MFNCDKCGMCCRNLNKSELYIDLDRGDGCCKYFDEETNLCNIYDDRPIKCRVDEMYKVYFQNQMTLDVFYSENYKACDKLKKEGT